MTPGAGSGAKFLVHWRADQPVSEPIVESIMIGTQMQQGISFISAAGNFLYLTRPGHRRHDQQIGTLL
jgi:hypothetical protein